MRQDPATSAPDFAQRYSKLQVTVVEARNLLAKDDDGASDLYCEAFYGSRKRTTTIRFKTLKPDW